MTIIKGKGDPRSKSEKEWDAKILKKFEAEQGKPNVGMAFDMAVQAHEGQKRWDNETPFVSHPIAVCTALAKAGASEEVQIVGLLHDTVEDTALTLRTLTKVGFSTKVTDAIDALTKQKGERYREYIQRVDENLIARMVKIVDIRHNASSIKPHTARWAKYDLALLILGALPLEINKHGK